MSGELMHDVDVAMLCEEEIHSGETHGSDVRV